MNYLNFSLIILVCYLSLAPSSPINKGNAAQKSSSAQKPQSSSSSSSSSSAAAAAAVAGEELASPTSAEAEPKTSLYKPIRELALKLAKKENWKRCIGKFICPELFNAGGEIGWAKSSTPNKQSQTNVCNINADSLFHLITGTSARYELLKPNVRRTGISSSQIFSHINHYLNSIFKVQAEPYLHHMIIGVDEEIFHYLLILQEGENVSLFQSYSILTANDPNKQCIYSLSDYLTKNAEQLFNEIILNKTENTTSSLTAELAGKGFSNKDNLYINKKTVPIELFKKDLLTLFLGEPHLSKVYQKLFACPLPNFYIPDYFSKKGKEPSVWIGVQSTAIKDPNLTHFKAKLSEEESCAK